MLEAGAIPFRIGERGPEYLLVTSRRGRWIFPKGRVRSDETLEEAALKEVEEEAGVLGRILPAPLGTYRDWRDGEACEVVMFLLAYEEESPRWRESGTRARRWCSFEAARDILKKGKLRVLLERAKERIEAARDPRGPEAERA